MRRVKALWNILSAAGRSTDVVGWWATWPAETIRGVDRQRPPRLPLPAGGRAQADRRSRARPIPPALEAAVAPLAAAGRRTSRARSVAAFVDVPAEEFARPFRLRRRPVALPLGLRGGAVVHAHRPPPLEDRAARQPARLRRGARLDLAPLRPPLPRRGSVGRARARSRSATGTPSSRCTSTRTASSGEFLAAMDRRTTLVVLSDHGFELGRLPDDPSKTRDMRRVSEKYHRLEGILYLYGRARPAAHAPRRRRRSSTSRRPSWR